MQRRERELLGTLPLHWPATGRPCRREQHGDRDRAPSCAGTDVIDARRHRRAAAAARRSSPWPRRRSPASSRAKAAAPGRGRARARRRQLVPGWSTTPSGSSTRCCSWSSSASSRRPSLTVDPGRPPLRRRRASPSSPSSERGRGLRARRGRAQDVGRRSTPSGPRWSRPARCAALVGFCAAAAASRAASSA